MVRKNARISVVSKVNELDSTVKYVNIEFSMASRAKEQFSNVTICRCND